MSEAEPTVQRTMCGGPHDGSVRDLPASMERLSSLELVVLHAPDGATAVVPMPGEYILAPGTSTMAWVEVPGAGGDRA